MDLSQLPADVWTSRLPASLLDRAPHIEERDGQAVWVCDGKVWGRWDGKPPATGSTRPVKALYNAFDRAASYDPSARRPANAELRLADMDRHGVAPQVILGPIFQISTDDAVLRSACYRVYNDWLLDFCKAAPDRLIGLPMLPETPEAAVAELERVIAKGGVRQVNLMIANVHPSSTTRRGSRSGKRSSRAASSSRGTSRCSSASRAIVPPARPRASSRTPSSSLRTSSIPSSSSSVASVETATIGGRRLLIFERYDRIVHADGRVERIHQEDFCQAAATLPDRKYEQDGGPPLRRIAGILQTVAKSGAAEALLRSVIVNVLVGNGDAHGKNFSLLHDSLGELRLSPLYDVVSTLFYGDDRLAMYIDDVRRANRVTVDRIVKEAARWGLPKHRAAAILEEILDRAPAAAGAAQRETVGLPEGLLKGI